MALFGPASLAASGFNHALSMGVSLTVSFLL